MEKQFTVRTNKAWERLFDSVNSNLERLSNPYQRIFGRDYFFKLHIQSSFNYQYI